MLLEKEEIEYLNWILSRIIYKFKDDVSITNRLKNIINKIKNPQLNISDSDLDKILPAYYADYNLEKEKNLGFDYEDRKQLKGFVVNLITDVLTKNFPKENIIKEK